MAMKHEPSHHWMCSRENKLY